MLIRIRIPRLLVSVLFTTTTALLSHRESHRLSPTFEGRHPKLPFLYLAGVNDEDRMDDDEDDGDDDVMGFPSRPEQSRMNDYISQFLRKGLDDSLPSSTGPLPPLEDVENTATHLIAVPMDTNHELLIELESVQRAILYHCPILADACIPGAATRLPLLYVKASPNIKTADATRWLSTTVQRLVEKHMFQPITENDEDISEDVLNEDRLRPLTMTFQSLEIDGANNNALYTVGTDRSGRINNLVKELKETVEGHGWQVALPLDPNKGGKDDSTSSPKEFRPRVCFMEIPKEFDDNLNKFKEVGTEIKEEDFEFLTASEGGNGISPIFWCQWWDDIFGRNIRLKEIGIYPRNVQMRTSSSDLSYVNFYMPYDTINLPAPTSGLLRIEEKFQKYQDDRMGAQEKEMEDPSSFDSRPNEMDDDLMLGKTQTRLEQLFQVSSGQETGYVGEDAVEGIEEEDKTVSIQSSSSSSVKEESNDEDITWSQQKASPNDFVEDWMKERIRKAIESQESEKVRKPQEKKVMPPIAENPIFKAYKDGSLTPKTEIPKSSKDVDLGPYPNPTHFAGIWRVISSPTGFPAEDSTNDSSENLILRIDGTIAGGPILDPATRQKAAGGTWKMILQNDDGSDGGEVRLRLRLLIPPKKERVIEMIGVVNRISMKSPQAPMTSRAFGIPYLEEMAKLSSTSSDMDDIMFCAGTVFVEDAITKKNREQIGEFSLSKLQGPKKPGEYTITIPKPI